MSRFWGLDGELRAGLGRTAAATLAACGARVGEAVLLLADDGSSRRIVGAFRQAATEAGHDVARLTVAARRPAFADLPPGVVEALLAADLVVDLTSVPWLYSDSLTDYAARAAERGSRLAFVWGDPGSERTLAACPPSPTLADRARAGLAALNAARRLRVRTPHGTDLTADLGDPTDWPRAFIGEPPVAAGQIGAPLCASVTMPFVPRTAEGTIAFVGVGRFQGPVNRPLWSDKPVTIEVRSGHVVGIGGDSAAAAEIADWRAAAPTADVDRVMDCNLGFDPRAELGWADNSVVHSFAGGLMVGIADPYRHDPAGSHRPGWHLDLMLPAVDLDLDDRPFWRGGRPVATASEHASTDADQKAP